MRVGLESVALVLLLILITVTTPAATRGKRSSWSSTSGSRSVSPGRFWVAVSSNGSRPSRSISALVRTATCSRGARLTCRTSQALAPHPPTRHWRARVTA